MPPLYPFEIAYGWKRSAPALRADRAGLAQILGGVALRKRALESTFPRNVAWRR